MSTIIKFVKTEAMPDALKYIAAENGNKNSVLVPVKTWEALNSNYQKLQNKIQVFTGIQNGLKEMRQAKKKGRPLQTLKDFLT